MKLACHKLVFALAALISLFAGALCHSTSKHHTRRQNSKAGGWRIARRQNIDRLITALSPISKGIPVVNKGLPVLSDVVGNSTAVQACQELERSSVSQSAVLYVGAIDYVASVDHYFSSSADLPACIFRPSSSRDLAQAMKVIAKYKVSFAVSSGKHTGNPGFSSTKGVQIDLRQFSRVELSEDHSYVDIGTGLVWDAVYDNLQGTGRTVLGGRTSGVGVGGFLTGGAGYSFLTNQYGPCVESIIHMDVVLPNGRIVRASQSELSDLFFALKGGGNQFGIVFDVRLKTFAVADQVWGGTRFYLEKTAAVRDATLTFLQNNKDPKAALIPTFNWVAGVATFGAIAFYDGPEPPAGTFEGFDGSYVAGDWSSTTLTAIIQSQLSNLTSGTRGRFHTVSIERYSRAILDIMIDAGERLSSDKLRSGVLFSLVPENALHGYGRHYDHQSPFPYGSSPQPLSLLFTWLSPLDDDYYVDQISILAQRIHDQAVAEGQKMQDMALYPNYALQSTPAVDLFGRRNLEALRRAKAVYDPEDTMRLTTSFAY